MASRLLSVFTKKRGKRGEERTSLNETEDAQSENGSDSANQEASLTSAGKRSQTRKTQKGFQRRWCKKTRVQDQEADSSIPSFVAKLRVYYNHQFDNEGAASLTSAGTQLQTRKLKMKSFQWPWWKKTKQTLRDNGADSKTIASCNVRADGGGDTEKDSSPLADRPETAVTHDGAGDTNLPPSATEDKNEIPPINRPDPSSMVERDQAHGGLGGVETVSKKKLASLHNRCSKAMLEGPDPESAHQHDNMTPNTSSIPEESANCLGLTDLYQTWCMSSDRYAFTGMTSFFEVLYTQWSIIFYLFYIVFLFFFL